MLDVFEGVFLVRRLLMYVRDTGLLHSLLGIPFSRRGLLAHPKAGASFESFCIEQIMLHARLHDASAEVFFAAGSSPSRSSWGSPRRTPGRWRRACAPSGSPGAGS
jgi:hypothetical protein